MYETLDAWPPFFDSKHAKEQKREDFYQLVGDRICNILSPIATKYNLVVGDIRDKILVTIREAGTLSIDLGKLACGLEIVDRDWFSNSQRRFVPSDQRMKTRFMDEPIDGSHEPYVSVILQPGLLKRGRDDGEAFDLWSVWSPAVVVLSELKVPEMQKLGDTEYETPLAFAETLDQLPKQLDTIVQKPSSLGPHGFEVNDGIEGEASVSQPPPDTSDLAAATPGTVGQGYQADLPDAKAPESRAAAKRRNPLIEDRRQRVRTAETSNERGAQGIVSQKSEEVSETKESGGPIEVEGTGSKSDGMDGIE